MKTILVPTDFSESSKAASDFAAALAKKKNVELCFIHVVEIPASPESVYYLNHELIQDMMTNAQDKLHKLSKEYSDVKDVKTFVTTSTALDGIQKGILSIEADLIVIGKHHSGSGLTDLLFDNHTEKIIHYAKCPVISVSSATEVGKWKNALIAIDLEACPEDLLTKTYKISKCLGLTPHYLWVTPEGYNPEQEDLNQLSDTLKDHYPGKNFHFSTFSSNDVVKGILEYSDRLNPDLVMVSTHGRTGLKRLIHGSVAERLLEKSPIPIMILQLDRISRSSKSVVA
jgi:nucleotide-binding universal stress UspA family protein